MGQGWAKDCSQLRLAVKENRQNGSHLETRGVTSSAREYNLPSCAGGLTEECRPVALSPWGQPISDTGSLPSLSLQPPCHDAAWLRAPAHSPPPSHSRDTPEQDERGSGPRKQSGSSLRPPGDPPLWGASKGWELETAQHSRSAGRLGTVLLYGYRYLYTTPPRKIILSWYYFQSIVCIPLLCMIFKQNTEDTFMLLYE